MNLVSSVRDGTFHYYGRPRKSLGWPCCYEAQVQELELIRDFMEVSMHISPSLLEHIARGRKGYPPDDVAKIFFVESHFTISNRVTGGLVRLFKQKLEIFDELSYKTIERRYDSLFSHILF